MRGIVLLGVTADAAAVVRDPGPELQEPVLARHPRLRARSAPCTATRSPAPSGAFWPSTPARSSSPPDRARSGRAAARSPGAAVCRRVMLWVWSRSASRCTAGRPCPATCMRPGRSLRAGGSVRRARDARRAARRGLAAVAGWPDGGRAGSLLILAVFAVSLVAGRRPPASAPSATSCTSSAIRPRELKARGGGATSRSQANPGLRPTQHRHRLAECPGLGPGHQRRHRSSSTLTPRSGIPSRS